VPYSAGTYTVAIDFATEAASPPIEIAKLDQQMQDMATALSTCMLRDGTGTPTATIPFGSQNITGAGTIGATVITGTVLHATAGGSDSYETYKAINAVKSLATYETGSFTATLTGCTTAPTGTVTWSRVGNTVTLNIATITATSNSTACTLTGLPANLQPTRQQRVMFYVVDNAAALPGLISCTSGSGTLTLYTTTAATYGAGTANLSPTGFTNSGTKGPGLCNFTYMLD
jgi:hypothetical protein